MTTPEIIEALTPYTGRFPRQAVEAAIAYREAITPHLLHALEEVANAPETFASREDYMLHTFAVYLLAQFRERRAFPLLIKILEAPADIPDELFGDTITESLKNILGSLYDGDPEPLKRLVEHDDVNEYVRGAAVEAFLVLAYTGQISREEVVRYYQSLFRGKLTRKYGQVWNDLACAVADLPAPELIEDLRQIFEEGLIDHGYADLKGLERDANTTPEQKPDWFREKLRLMGDAVSEMEWWAAFHRDEPTRLRKRVKPPTHTSTRLPDQTEVRSPTPRVNTPPRRAAKIGRNEPCPCGSGKKYKKCCLGKTETEV
jgi:hypothetical protein